MDFSGFNVKWQKYVKNVHFPEVPDFVLFLSCENRSDRQTDKVRIWRFGWWFKSQKDGWWRRRRWNRSWYGLQPLTLTLECWRIATSFSQTDPWHQHCQHEQKVTNRLLSAAILITNESNGLRGVAPDQCHHHTHLHLSIYLSVYLSGLQATRPVNIEGFVPETDSDYLCCVQELHNKGADPNAHTKHGHTPLMAASSDGDLDHARLLLQRGINPSM